MTREDALAAAQFWLDSPIFRSQRRPRVSRLDFGEQESIGLHVRRRGGDWFGPEEGNFGIYLGQHDAGYVVAVKWNDLDKHGFSGCEVFASLEELRREWELD